MVGCELLQLNQARQNGHVLLDFEEGSLDFKPTFKYDFATNNYDTR